MAVTPFPGTPSAIDFTSGAPLYIAPPAAEVPPALLIEDAIRDGLISQVDAKAAGQSAVTIAEESTTLYDLASAAALSATGRAATPAADISSLLFASVFPYTRPAGYNMTTALAEAVGSPCAFGAEIAGSCVAGINSLVLAAQRLILTNERAALIVAGDIYRQPHIDRFNTEPGIIFADGTAAVVLGRDETYARLLSAATLSDPSLSSMHDYVPSTRTPIDLTVRAQAFFENRMEADEALARIGAGLTTTVDAALSTARLSLTDVAYILVPTVGEIFLHRNYLDPLNMTVSQTTWEHTAVTGHIGAADQLSALAYLVDQDRCKSGDVILLIAEGGGFQWSVVAVEVQ